MHYWFYLSFLKEHNNEVLKDQYSNFKVFNQLKIHMIHRIFYQFNLRHAYVNKFPLQLSFK